MALICLNPPLVEPVDLTELKQMLRIDASDTSQDGVLVSLQMAARNWCEAILNRRCVRQTWRLMMDFFPGYIDTKLAGQRVSSPFVSGSNAVLVGIRYAIALPFPPVQTIVNFNYQDANGNVTSMITSPASFIQDLQSEPARLTPVFGQMWPVARVVPNAVQVDYTVGYASPIAVQTVNQGSPATPNGITVAGLTSGNVGQPISIPGAGSGGVCLNTIITAVGGGTATLRDSASASGISATALLVNYGKPGHWENIKLAIKLLVNDWFINRVPNLDPKASATRSAALILSPCVDKRY